MPKKKKMIKCNRCGRTIPAEDFRGHTLGHLGKSVVTPSKLFAKSILSRFEASLREVNAHYSAIQLFETEKPVNAQVSFDEKRKLTLTYNPRILRGKEEIVLDGILLHEACHVSTLVSPFLKVPDTSNPHMTKFLGDSLTNYDEYLAHVEFVKKFRNDPRFEGLKRQQIGLFKNFEKIINLLRMAEPELQSSRESYAEFIALGQLGSIIYDSMFFFVTSDNSFSEWCIRQSLTELEVLIGWVYQDFEYIRSLNLSQEKSHDKVIASTGLCGHVNPLKLLLHNKIEFYDATKSFHENWRKIGQDTDLVELWEKRRLKYQKN
ncbi:MAG TPA: hypothetical protein VI864_03630 [Candidatus Bathyarchaeia archaeon]|nr:hypothetical protein [Candidatus Bathyarchaeia archaeon]